MTSDFFATSLPHILPSTTSLPASASFIYLFERLLVKGLLASLTLRSFGASSTVSSVGNLFRGLSTLTALGELLVADLRASLALRRPPIVLGVPWVLDPSYAVDSPSRSTLPCLLSPFGIIKSSICVS